VTSGILLDPGYRSSFSEKVRGGEGPRDRPGIVSQYPDMLTLASGTMNVNAASSIAGSGSTWSGGDR
jgi:hypothetical protein